ncbi:I78 family peptidase inhibitor [Pseudoroseicyclus tamaricis]|uniref:Peptidase inhibitor I78 family protein n=1 Tax=Pseudoroseicyclus tamaricis TaxID=2705421 RepID=A0A6B2JYG4_9RHOB|nr:I78 family peptidase inhibitor [Pseudoroseicyclus tamaricis]NDV02805.1 hypothetical protein [Pseudoroseicyclus tamaricis]
MRRVGRPAAFRLPLLLLPLLAACAGAPPPAPPPPPLPAPEVDSCNAAARSGLIGREREALERQLILAPVRVIDPGDAVTEDLMPGRINFYIDAGGRIARITCG